MSRSKRTSKYTVRVDNVYFLSRIGLSLRWATQDIADEDLPADVRQLLARLVELEEQEELAREAAQRPVPDTDTPA